jgi:hypothetical protein
MLMTSTAEEKAFLRVAVAAIPRVAEIIGEFAPDDRAGALEVKPPSPSNGYNLNAVAKRPSASIGVM